MPSPQPVRRFVTGPQPDVTFGPVAATVDYSALATMRPEQQQAYFDGIYAKLAGPDEKIWPQISALDDDQRFWMINALYLFARNLLRDPPQGFDVRAAVFRMIRRSGQRTTMPGDPNGVFEREALSASGWTAMRLIAAQRPPEQSALRDLDRLYNPRGRGGDPLPPLRADVLRAKLLPALIRMLKNQLGNWQSPEGGSLDPEPIERVRGVATFVQEYVRLAMGPWAFANHDGPYFQGFQYDQRLQSTEELAVDFPNLLNYLTNRADLIGRLPEYGQPLIEANYDGGRPTDKEAMRQLMTEWLREPSIAKAVALLIKRTGAHSGGEGNVSIQPTFPSSNWGTKANWRWRLVRTLIHEFIHRLAHPDFTAKAAMIGHGQIVREGFVDLLTNDIFGRLVADVERHPQLYPRLLGDVELGAEPDPSFLRVGYGNAGQSAELIRQMVGDDAVRAAFFLGATKLIGLP